MVSAGSRASRVLEGGACSGRNPRTRATRGERKLRVVRLGATTTEGEGKGEGKGDETTMKDNPGFWYDKANLRWVRDDKRGLPLSEWEEGGLTTMKTKTGEEYTLWPVIHIRLSNSEKFSVIDPEDVEEMVKSGKAVVIDVRPEYQYKGNGHISESVNVPLYRSVQGQSFFKTLKKIAVAAMAMKATERNPDFVQDACEALSTTKPEDEDRLLICCCSIGGSMETEVVSKRGKVFSDPEKAFGRESRSLKACYELIQAGFPKVAHLRGGIAMWRHKDMPMTK
ncbi:rhodanese-like domain-containing protein [Chloropicon primus]|uniref:Rhodanese-like domain-containing protein n=1 Tax=Chloropicon primus TaxID=1764295 RepID=A0A5B8MGD9_9CHLO|nr:rhodanese-like domain-containing protein [Chloropicon primus]|eukprot:QDZ19457.1 rhodanese-like domain-containing protein [Chloropicon primus]